MKKSAGKSEAKLIESKKAKMKLQDLFFAQQALEALVSNVTSGKVCNKINDIIIEIKAANESYRKTVEVKNDQSSAFQADLIEKYNPSQYDVKTDEGKKALEKVNLEIQTEMTHEGNAANIEINRAGVQEVEFTLKSPRLVAKEIYDWTFRPINKFNFGLLTQDYLKPFLI